MIFKYFSNIFNDFINLIYPDLCFVCDDKLMKNERFFCTPCLSDIPRTNFHNNPENPVSRIFWGRIDIQQATSLFYFKKGSKYRVLLHKLKYKGQKEIGLELGKMLGNELLNTDFSKTDFIIPVPLHSIKEHKRGFNQSEIIAEGIAEKLNKPVLKNCLYRKINTDSQTVKGRYNRWENVDGIFEIRNGENLKNKHVLLVDDIVTTGATLEACSYAIKKDMQCTLSIATLAYTS